MRQIHVALTALVVALGLTGFTSVPRAAAAGPLPGPFNTAQTHSPQLLKSLSGPLSGTGSPSVPVLRGTDVAAFQHPDGVAVNWAQVAAAGYKFVAIKATESTYYRNPYYAVDAWRAMARGLFVSPYAFGIPNRGGGGAAQASYAIRAARYTPGPRVLPFMLDIEYDPYVSSDHTNECYGMTRRRMILWIAGFSNRIEQLTGEPPIIYTTAGWWQACTGNTADFRASPLWIAAWATGHPGLPPGWQTWTFWQYTASGTVRGIATPGSTDLDYFNERQVMIASPGDQSGAADRAVSVQVNSLNESAREPLRYTAAGLPPGLVVGRLGWITGTARQAGSYHVTVSVRDPAGGTGSVSFTWDVHAASSGRPGPGRRR
jgi:GH25 family lysozyme M1 (1,4-beta-N-acetylmuramidase)